MYNKKRDVYKRQILLSSKSTVRLGRKKLRVISIAAYAALMFLYVGEIQNSAVQSFFGMDTTLFTLNVLYRNNGIAAAFLGNLRFLNIEQPSGYSVDKVDALMKQVEADEQGEEDAKNEPETDAQGETVQATQGETVPVSYTHLDVYKRQGLFCCMAASQGTQPASF